MWKGGYFKSGNYGLLFSCAFIFRFYGQIVFIIHFIWLIFAPVTLYLQ
jgi:hypothetical protein